MSVRSAKAFLPSESVKSDAQFASVYEQLSALLISKTEKHKGLRLHNLERVCGPSASDQSSVKTRSRLCKHKIYIPMMFQNSIPLLIYESFASCVMFPSDLSVLPTVLEIS